MRCLRLRSASLWFLLVPLLVVAGAGAEQSASNAASASSLWKGTIPASRCSRAAGLGLKRKEAGTNKRAI
jgi:hypothetical protein